MQSWTSIQTRLRSRDISPKKSVQNKKKKEELRRREKPHSKEIM